MKFGLEIMFEIPFLASPDGEMILGILWIELALGFQMKYVANMLNLLAVNFHAIWNRFDRLLSPISVCESFRPVFDSSSLWLVFGKLRG